MTYSANSRFLHRRLIVWLLLLSFLSLTLFPYHYHLDHSVVSAPVEHRHQNHSLDFHAHWDGEMADYEADHTIEPASDTLVAKGVRLPPALLVLGLLILLPSIRRIAGHNVECLDTLHLDPFRHDRPPLRAPPPG
ncbi:MAG: hypothetical protein KJ558_06670 [Gammaproteobacteria bacterium]|nr:hypothetical protein [Gammaproteobacteria bacterium]MBU1654501.1 hypothetical protein [Gammaproteobacteria bacterium]MBU1961319.1 hypothetical protein [Gammaproteobacteria bacterium]